MRQKTEYQIGQRVQYRSGGSWNPLGVIVDKEPAITINNAVLVSPHYKVRWDDGDESGWLSWYDLEMVES